MTVTPRFLFDLGDRTFAIYDDGPASARARVERTFGFDAASTLRYGGWFDHDTCTIDDAPDEASHEYGDAWHGERHDGKNGGAR